LGDAGTSLASAPSAGWLAGSPGPGDGGEPGCSGLRETQALRRRLAEYKQPDSLNYPSMVRNVAELCAAASPIDATPDIPNPKHLRSPPYMPEATPPAPNALADRDLPRLRFLSGSRRDGELVVPGDGCTIGRSHRCTIRLDQAVDTLVSGQHVKIGPAADGTWWIEDLGSTNGTWLDNRKLEGRTAIPPENEFTLGKPGLDGSVRLYVAFPALRRKARSTDPPRVRIADVLAELDRAADNP
jgi:hypothetical protein